MSIPSNEVTLSRLAHVTTVGVFVSVAWGDDFNTAWV